MTGYDAKDAEIKKLKAKVKARELVIDTLRGMLFTAWQLTCNYEKAEEDAYDD
jgi:hypothetical protein